MRTLRRVLIVANRTAATPDLLAEIERRALVEPTSFTLLIPETMKGKHADWTLDQALAALRKAAAGPTRTLATDVDGRIAERDPLAAIEAALADDTYDEIVISTLPARRSRWLSGDLPGQVRKLGLPVTVVTPPQEQKVGLKDVAFLGQQG